MHKLAKYHNDIQSDVNGSQVIHCFSAVLYYIILDIVSDIFQIVFRYFRYTSDISDRFQFDNKFDSV